MELFLGLFIWFLLGVILWNIELYSIAIYSCYLPLGSIVLIAIYKMIRYMAKPKIYKIVHKIGKHRPHFHFNPWMDNTKMDVIHCETYMFTSNSIYQYKKTDNDDEDTYKVEFTNKLHGVGFGIDHHQDSCRISWRPNFEENPNNEINLYGYTYKDGELTTTFICSIDLYTKVQLNIYLMEKDVMYQVITLPYLKKESISFESPYIPINRMKFGYKLYEYFGGEYTPEEQVEYLKFKK